MNDESNTINILCPCIISRSMVYKKVGDPYVLIQCLKEIIFLECVDNNLLFVFGLWIFPLEQVTSPVTHGIVFRDLSLFEFQNLNYLRGFISWFFFFLSLTGWKFYRLLPFTSWWRCFLVLKYKKI